MAGVSVRRGASSPSRTCVLHPALPSSPAAGRKRTPSREPESRLAEAVSLARAIDLDVVFAEFVPVKKPRPATLFGPGRVEAVAEATSAHGLELAIVDGALTPVQQRKSRTRVGLQGHRPHCAHPRNLRRTGTNARGPAAGRACSTPLSTEPPGEVRGRTWSVSAAVSASWAGRVKRRSRPIGARFAPASAVLSARSTQSSAPAACIARHANAFPIR